MTRPISRRNPLEGVTQLLVDGTNLFDTEYQEVAGVRMPGAAMMVTLRVSR